MSNEPTESPQALWGTIRSLVHATRRPTPDHWSTLLATIDAMPEAQAREAVLYTQQALKDLAIWPAKMRTYRLPWGVKDEQPMASFDLVKVLRASTIENLKSWLECADVRLDALDLDLATTADHLRAIFGLSALAQLTYLSIHSGHYSNEQEEDYMALEDAPFLEQLQGLDISRVDSDNYQKLGKLIARMTSLERVKIPWLDEGRTTRFAKFFATHKLSVLDLSECSFSLQFFKALRSKGELGALKVLNLNNYRGNTNGLTTLFGPDYLSRTFSKLHTLHLSNVSITPKVIDILCTSPCAQSLRHLKLSQNTLSSPQKGLQALADAGVLGKLRTLHLANTGLKDGDISALLSHDFKHIEEIDLGENALTSASLEALMEAKLPGLRRLDVSRIDVDAQELAQFAETSATRWPKMQWIAMRPAAHALDDDACQAISFNAHPDTRIITNQRAHADRKIAIHEYAP